MPVRTARVAPMMTVGYVIAGVLLGGATLLAAGACVGVWFGIRALRPELLEKR